MDSDEKVRPEIRARGMGIEMIGIVAGSVLLGAAGAVAVLRALAGGVETISMTGLLTFFVTTGMASAAIVLSIVAIAFSRSAERAICRKSEEINGIQDTLSAKVDEAVGQIETSAARIGQRTVDAISSELQENLPSRDVLRADVMEAVERALADAMIFVEGPEKIVGAEEEPFMFSAMVEEPVPEVEEVVEEEPVVEEDVVQEEPVPPVVTGDECELADKKYGEFKDIVLLGVANYPGVVSRKIGEGQYRTEGDDLVDGAFVVNNERLAVCTFCTSNAISERFVGEKGDSFTGFLKSLLTEIRKGHFSRVFLVFDSPLSSSSSFAKSLNILNGRVNDETFSRFELFEGVPSEIIPQLTERVSQLMDAEPVDSDETDEDIPDLSFRRQMLGA